jgi:hypothetical protein
MVSLVCHRRGTSRFQHLVALLPPLHTLHAPLVHLLLHFGEAFSLLLRCALRSESVGSSLFPISIRSSHIRVQARTWRSASFSSFISFSFALTAASAFLSSVRLSHEVWLARGRKAVLLSCHCLPGKNAVSLQSRRKVQTACTYHSSSFP